MKKVIIGLLAVVMGIMTVCLLSGCNKQIFDFEYEYEYVHVNSTGKCYKITSWTDYEDGEQLQVKLEDGTLVLISANNCELIKGTCPFCKDHN